MSGPRSQPRRWIAGRLPTRSVCDRSVSYRFTPTHQVAGTSPDFLHPIGDRPLRLVVEDASPEAGRESLGTWTTRDVRVLPLGTKGGELLSELSRGLALEGSSWRVPAVETGTGS